MNAVAPGPIVKTLEVGRSTAETFRMFTAEMSRWWPTTHTMARDTAGEKTLGVTVEPRVGGRVYETVDTGAECDWGLVLAWEPGARFAMTWQLGRKRAESGEVEVRFEPVGRHRCRVVLTHSHWERLGDEGETLRGNYDGGWDFVFGQCFAGYAQAT